MLTQDSSQGEESLKPFKEETLLSKEQADIEALRAAYWNVKNASVPTFCNNNSILHLHVDEIPTANRLIQKTCPEPVAPPLQDEISESAFEKDLQMVETVPEEGTVDSSLYDSTPEVEPTLAWVEVVLETDNQDAQDELSVLFQTDMALDLSNQVESWLVKLCSRPRLAAGIVGMCLLASSVYVSLGYWFLSSSVSNAAEPINMMQVQESPFSPKTTGNPALNHIKTLQEQPAPKAPKTPKGQQGTLLALATTPAKVTALVEPQQAPSSDDDRIREPELLGRADPFSPLVQLDTSNQAANSATPVKKDVLQDMQYTGFVGNTNAKKKLAIIKVADPGGGNSQTLIKKVGDSFYVSGERVTLKGISKTALQLYTSGENRKLSLSPYAITSTASASSSGTLTESTASNSSSSNSAAAGSTGTSTGNSPSSGNLGNLGAISGNGNHTANPQLREP